MFSMFLALALSPTIVISILEFTQVGQTEAGPNAAELVRQSDADVSPSCTPMTDVQMTDTDFLSFLHGLENEAHCQTLCS